MIRIFVTYCICIVKEKKEKKAQLRTGLLSRLLHLFAVCVFWFLNSRLSKLSYMKFRMLARTVFFIVICIFTAVHSFQVNVELPNSRYLSMSKGFGAKSKISYTGKLSPGVISPTLEVPKSIQRPDYAADGKPKNKRNGMPWEIQAQTTEDIARSYFFL